MRAPRMVTSIAMLIATTSAAADMLQVSFVDAVGDQLPIISADRTPIDLLGMQLIFDNRSGGFSVTFTASTEHPLQGGVMFNANLLNGDVPNPPPWQYGTDVPLPANYFVFNFNKVYIEQPMTSFTLTGQNEHLTHWKAGDRVATDTDAFPNIYYGRSFATDIERADDVVPGVVYDISGINGIVPPVFQAFDNFLPFGSTVAVISTVPVPVPPVGLLLALTAIPLLLRRRAE